MHGIDEVAFATWRHNCVECHGTVGRGDGPRAAQVKTPDLTNFEWQQTRSDQEISQSIRGGRGQMPAFDLPQPTISALVKLVRLIGGHLRLDPVDAGSASTSPLPSASANAPRPTEPRPPQPPATP
jgi:mono/diheme cytochrome c family protein